MVEAAEIAVLSPAPGKACGECGMCCKVLGIAELGKAPGSWCPRFVRGRGCGQYDVRPGACRSFMCEWLLSRDLGPEWRPDRCKFVLQFDDDKEKLCVVVDPAAPLAWKREPYYSKIKRLSERTEEGAQILVCIGQRRIVVFPHEDVDLGICDPEAKIVSGYARRDGEKVAFAMLLKDAEPSAA